MCDRGISLQRSGSIPGLSERILFILILVVASATAAVGRAEELDDEDIPLSIIPVSYRDQIERGFNLLYELKFVEARRQFASWQQKNPDDPLGHVSMAAGYLFEEFYYQNVLTSDFFLNDKRLLGGIDGKPDHGRATKFEEEDRKGIYLATNRLRANARDSDALFALTLATGMRADFKAILERRQMESLVLIKEAEHYAEELLEVKPDAADAWLSLGAANYILGSLPAYKRFFLWFDQIHGDKSVGMQQLRITASKGHYLKPFAEILLALAALREKQDDVARMLLSQLVAQYPDNHLFASELARLN